MKTLFFVRHAKSSWMDPLQTDHERPLNQRGIRDAKLMPEYIKKQKEKPPTFIVSSTAKRALVTAKYFGEFYEIEKDKIVLDEKLYHANESSIYEVIFGLPDSEDVIMLFGHNPGFTEMSNLFTDHFIENVPTCGIVRLNCKIDRWEQFSPDSCRLKKFYFPKQFMK